MRTPGAVHDTSSEVDAGGFMLGAALSSLRERGSIGGFHGVGTTPKRRGLKLAKRPLEAC